MWLLKKLHPNISRAYWHVQEEKDQLQLYDDVFFQRIHFADEHKDKRHGGRYHFARKRCLTFDILPSPLSQFEPQEFFFSNNRSTRF
jgi:hypothetical protein